MVTRDTRFKLVDGYNLQIDNVRIQDAGDYVAQVAFCRFPFPDWRYNLFLN